MEWAGDTDTVLLMAGSVSEACWKEIATLGTTQEKLLDEMDVTVYEVGLDLKKTEAKRMSACSGQH